MYKKLACLPEGIFVNILRGPDLDNENKVRIAVKYPELLQTLSHEERRFLDSAKLLGVPAS